MVAFMVILFFLTVWCTAENSADREVSIKIALDNSLQNRNLGRVEFTRLVRDAGQIFRSHFGIHFKVKEIIFWDPNNSGGSLFSCLNDLRQQVEKTGKDIVIGVISPKHTNSLCAGISNYLNGYILLKNLNSFQSLERVLIHEFCHLFGALDIREKGSFMNITGPGYRLDAFTKKIIKLNTNRSFDLHSFPLKTPQIFTAIEYYLDRLNQHPKEFEIRIALAHLFLNAGLYSEAINEGRKVLQQIPGRKGIHTTLGNIYFVTGKYENTINEYHLELNLQPSNPEVYYNLGLTYSKKGSLDQAKQFYMKACLLDPSYTRARNNLRSLFARTGVFLAMKL